MKKTQACHGHVLFFMYESNYYYLKKKYASGVIYGGLKVNNVGRFFFLFFLFSIYNYAFTFVLQE